MDRHNIFLYEALCIFMSFCCFYFNEFVVHGHCGE